jgi:glycosyltransferase involved in cell wall biosynthesis
MKKIAIHQFLPSFSPWDAIGNETRLMREELRAMGFESEIFCEHRHRSMRREAIQVNGSKMRDLGPNILIFHFSVATTALLRMASSKSAVCLRYHNVTPEWFFDPIKDAAAHAVCKLGRRQLPMAASIARWGLADSHFNAKDLWDCGMQDVEIMPLFRDYEVMAKTNPDPHILNALRSKPARKTILFVGRLAPNKRQEDLVQLVKVYQDCVDKNLRLILVGGAYSLAYDHALKQFARELGLTVTSGRPSPGEDFDVLFAGAVSDGDLASYYAGADAFTCVSEHEGFCVPIVEAMGMGLPILAHASTAVTETVGDAGVVLNKADHVGFLQALDRLLNDAEMRCQLKKNAAARLTSLSLPTVRSAFGQFVNHIVQDVQSDIEFIRP